MLDTPEAKSFVKDLDDVLGSIRELLISKNESYGNSALGPIRVFSKALPDQQLLVRIDDKLSRIANGSGMYANEDTVTDLIGYLLLLKISESRKLRGYEAYVERAFA